jgi:transposase
VIGLPVGTRVWLVAGVTDMQRGFDGLAAIVQTALDINPFGGQVFAFCGKRGALIKSPPWEGHDPFPMTD